jgi:penicillin-insensitive murein endopeptidase
MIRILAALGLALLAATAEAETAAKALFSAVKAPSAGTALAYGSYAKGCLAGAVQLAESGPTWQAMRLSRNRHSAGRCRCSRRGYRCRG